MTLVAFVKDAEALLGRERRHPGAVHVVQLDVKPMKRSPGDGAVCLLCPFHHHAHREYAVWLAIFARITDPLKEANAEDDLVYKCVRASHHLQRSGQLRVLS